MNPAWTIVPPQRMAFDATNPNFDQCVSMLRAADVAGRNIGVVTICRLSGRTLRGFRIIQDDEPRRRLGGGSRAIYWFDGHGDRCKKARRGGPDCVDKHAVVDVPVSGGLGRR